MSIFSVTGRHGSDGRGCSHKSQ